MSKLICSQCGNTGRPKKVIKGTIIIEIILWLCIIIPGVIYSIWRHTTRHKTCGLCGSDKLVALDSSLGKKLQKDFSK